MKANQETELYDAAIHLRDRCIGFAVLLDAAFDNGRRFTHEEGLGVSRLARDIAQDAEALFQRIRADQIAHLGLKEEG